MSRRFFSSVTPQAYIQKRTFYGSEGKFLREVRSSKFSEAMDTFRVGQTELSEYTAKNNKAGRLTIYDDYSDYNPGLEHRNEYNEDKIAAIQHAARQVHNLFNNQAKCLSLLKELDNQIALVSKMQGWGLEELSPGKIIQFNDSLYLPAAFTNTENLIDDTYDLHLYLMREKLNKANIDCQNKHYYFAGFVDRKVANNIIRNGSLFSEELSIGSLLVHGGDTHYFHWYLLACALEKEVFRFKNNLTLHDFLQATTDCISWLSGNSLWDILIDHFVPGVLPNMSNRDFYKGSPFRMNIMLLLSEETPYLRGYMLNQWYQTVARIQSLYFKKNKQQIPYECLVGAHAASKNSVTGIELLSVDDLVHLKDERFLQLNATNKTGVYYRDTEKMFYQAKKVCEEIFYPRSSLIK